MTGEFLERAAKAAHGAYEARQPAQIPWERLTLFERETYRQMAQAVVESVYAPWRTVGQQ